jgi:hypothetical protein
MRSAFSDGGPLVALRSYVGPRRADRRRGGQRAMSAGARGCDLRNLQLWSLFPRDASR